MTKINIRTITSSILIDYFTDEVEIISQLEKVSQQIKIIEKTYPKIKTLRISIIFKQKISISSISGLINKLIFITIVLSVISGVSDIFLVSILSEIIIYTTSGEFTSELSQKLISSIPIGLMIILISIVSF